MILKIVKFKVPAGGGFSIFSSKLGNIYDYIPSDTFWSALVNVISLVDGVSEVENFVEKCENGKIVFSSAFPYYVLNGETIYFLPFPNVPLCCLDCETSVKKAFDIKRIKTYRWISASNFAKLQKNLQIDKGNSPCFNFFDIDNIIKCENKLEVELKEVFKRGVTIRSSIDRLVNCANPYASVFVKVKYERIKEAGLYLLILLNEEEGNIRYFEDKVLKYFEILAKQGIGGRRSYGYGFFEEVEVIESKEKFPVSIAFVSSPKGYEKVYYVNLSMLFASRDALRKVIYKKMESRGGYVTYITPQTVLKPKMYSFKEGSLFEDLVSGEIVKIKYQNNSYIYHYGKSVFAFIGVK